MDSPASDTNFPALLSCDTCARPDLATIYVSQLIDRKEKIE